MFEAVQLAIATLGGNNNGMLPALLIVIAPSPAVATSTSASSRANPSMSPWDMADVVNSGLVDSDVPDMDADHSYVVSTTVLGEVDPDVVLVDVDSVIAVNEPVPVISVSAAPNAPVNFHE